MADPRPEPLQPPHLEFELASVWARLGGRILDFVLIYFVGAIVLLSWLDLEADPEALEESGDLLQVALMLLTIGFVYEVVLTATWGKTIGKAVVGTKVLGTGGADPPTWPQSTFRVLVPMVPSLLIPAFGGLIQLAVYTWLVWDANRQGLHDKVAKTYVVLSRPKEL